MILEFNPVCCETVYICQFDNEEFDNVLNLKKHIEESIKSRTEVLKKFIDYHCLGIDILMKTNFLEFICKFIRIATELARLIDEYREVKEFISNEDCSKS